jgi:NADPH-dependent F420 reductase
MSGAYERVAILGGSGALGFGLAIRLARAGVAVVIGSRSADRAREAAVRALDAVPDGDVIGLENANAVADAGVVVLSVPFGSQADTIRIVKDAFRAETLVVDATVPLAPAVGGRPTRTVGVWQGSAAQQAAELVPDGVRVVSALHTVAASLLSNLDHELDQDVLVCGDRKADKAAVAALLERVPGLRCVDCGKLEQARITESLTALMIGINVRYKTHAGVRITGLPAAAGLDGLAFSAGAAS